MCLCLFLQNIIYLIQINQSLQLGNVPLPRRLCFSPMWVFLCFLVGLSAGLHRNHWPDFHNTWMEDINPTDSWVLSGYRYGTRIIFCLCSTLEDRAFSTFLFVYIYIYHFNRFYVILYQAWLNRWGTIGTWLDVCAQLGAVLVITANVLPVILSCDILWLSDWLFPEHHVHPSQHPIIFANSAHLLAWKLCQFSTEVSPRWSPLSLHPDTRTCTPHGPQKKLGAALRKTARN